MKTIYSVGMMCLLLVLLISCSKMPFPTQAIPEATGMITSGPSPTGSSSVTGLSPLTTTPTEENTAGSQKLMPCINVGNPLPLSASSPLAGTLIFKLDTKIVAVSGDSLAEQEIIDLASVDEDWFIVGVSPGGEWFGYFTQSSLPEKKTTAHLISSAREAISVTLPILPALPTSSMGYDWFPVDWVNSENLLVAGGVAMGGATNIALFNPFTGTWNQSPLDSLPDHRTESGAAFSPDLTRALYVIEYNEGLVLWDVENQQELWRERLSSPYSSVPGLAPMDWSMDSSVLAFPLLSDDGQTERLYIIGRDGDQAWLIRPNVPKNSSYGFSWSPDGSYLAFVAPLASDPEHIGIIIYNRVENTATDLCPLSEGENPISKLETNGRLVWSPDSRYLVYGMGQDVNGEDNRVVMLDIFSGEMTVLKEGPGITMVGWSGVDSWVEP